MSNPGREILHVNTDDFFASVARLDNPTLKKKAVVIAGDNPRGMVFSASYEARAEGVKRGMTVSTARRLAPRAVFLPPDWSLFRRVSSAIFSLLMKYSPVVERSTLDEGYLDYTGCRRLFGPVLDVARRIKREVLFETGLSVSIGVASSRIVSHVASKRAKRAHLVDVYPGYERGFLSSVPIAEFPLVDDRRAQLLNELGVRFVGDLLCFSEELMVTAFGSWGRKLYRGALGEDVRPLRQRRPLDDCIELSEILEPDRVSPGFIEASLYGLCERLGEWLRKERLLVSYILLELVYADGVAASGKAHLDVPTSGDREIFESIRGVVPRVYRRRVRVRRLTVRVLRTEPEPLQRNLFEEGERGKAARLYRALDTLRERFPGRVAPAFGRVITG